MTEPERLHVGDTTTFVGTIKDQDKVVVDVSGVTAKAILLRDPDGNVSSHAAGFTTDGTDGKIEYTCATTDIDDDGRWHWRGEVTFADGTHYESDTHSIYAHERWTA